MATLIKVGKVYINFDNVTQINDLGNRMRVLYNDTEYGDFYDDAAAALRAWLDVQARDIEVEVAGMEAAQAQDKERAAYWPTVGDKVRYQGEMDTVLNIYAGGIVNLERRGSVVREDVYPIK